VVRPDDSERSGDPIAWWHFTRAAGSYDERIRSTAEAMGMALETKSSVERLLGFKK
jgi:hypothetical protein